MHKKINKGYKKPIDEGQTVIFYWLLQSNDEFIVVKWTQKLQMFYEGPLRSSIMFSIV